MSNKTYPWEKVSLRPLDDAPAEVFKVWQNDATLREMTIGFPFPAQLVTVEEWQKKKAASSGSTSASFAIFMDETPIGACFLDGINWIHRTASLGVYIGSPETRGSGAGYCASCRLLAFAFQSLDLRRVELDVLATNVAAIRLYQRIGFTHEGIARSHRFVVGQATDVHRFGLLAEEFDVAMPAPPRTTP